jgi:hypothetical protein
MLSTVLVMLLFIAFGTARWPFHTRSQIDAEYPRYRVILGKALVPANACGDTGPQA